MKKVVVTGVGYQGALANSLVGFGAALHSGQGAFAWHRMARSGHSFPAALYNAAASESTDRERQILRGRPVAMRASCASATCKLAALSSSTRCATKFCATNS